MVYYAKYMNMNNFWLPIWILWVTLKPHQTVNVTTEEVNDDEKQMVS